MKTPPVSAYFQSLLLAFIVVITPAPTLAQALLTGTITTPDGSPAPGVVVQIEGRAGNAGARLGLTDSGGRFRLEGLRPGVYDLTVRSARFKGYRLTGIELAGSRGTVVSIALQAGSPQEIVVVQDAGAGEGIRSVVRQTTLDRALLYDLPTIRSLNSLVTFVPGVTTDRNDVVFEPAPVSFSIFGGRPREGRLTVDGTPVMSGPDGGQAGHYLVNSIQEVTITSAGLGEVENAGPVVNIVPLEGANAFHGSVRGAGNSDGMVGDYLREEQLILGVSPVTLLRYGLDVEAGAGGALRADRVWYFVTGRQQRNEKTIVNLFPNRNAGNASTFVYQRDFSQQAYSDRTWENLSARLTFSTGGSGRASVLHDEQSVCARCSGATDGSGLVLSNVSPEAQGVGDITPLRLTQLTWRSPFGDRAFFDAGVSRYTFNWGNSERDGNPRAVARAVDTAVGLTYRSQDWAENDTSSTTWRLSWSRTLGAHALTVGHQGLLANDDRTSFTNDQAMTIRLSNGVPNLITQVIAPFTTMTRLSQLSAYAQDSWTGGRLALHGAVRYDHARSWYPEQRLTGTRFAPGLNLLWPRTAGVDAFSDLSPRAGAAYDLAGDGRTIVRVTGGRYLEGASTTGVYADMNPVLNFGRSTTRVWTDRNANYVPDCDLLNMFPNGECGMVSNPQFGTFQPLTTFDGRISRGFGTRPWDWTVGASVDRRLAPRVSLEAGYYRRWFGGFTVVDNLAVPREAYNSFSVTVPADPSQSSGATRTIGPLYDVNPVYFGRFLQAVAPAEAYGKQTLSTDSVIATLNGRLVPGLEIRAGASSSRTASDSCAIRQAVPESALLNPYCSVSTGFLTQVRVLATYAFAATGIHVGAVYQNKPGPPLAVLRAISTAAISPSLGRPLSGNAPNVSVNIIEPGSLYGDRIEQLDVRVAKVFRFGARQASVGLDVFNLFNGAAPIAYSTTFIGTVAPLPTTVMTPRLFRIGGSFEF